MTLSRPNKAAIEWSEACILLSNHHSGNETASVDVTVNNGISCKTNVVFQ